MFLAIFTTTASCPALRVSFKQQSFCLTIVRLTRPLGDPIAYDELSYSSPARRCYNLVNCERFSDCCYKWLKELLNCWLVLRKTSPVSYCITLWHTMYFSYRLGYYPSI